MKQRHRKHRRPVRAIARPPRMMFNWFREELRRNNWRKRKRLYRKHAAFYSGAKWHGVIKTTVRYDPHSWNTITAAV